MGQSEQKTKKQHYVPQCYLKAWGRLGKYQVSVYDKLSDTARISSIRDVASENYFYDIVPSDIMKKDVIDYLKASGIEFDADTSSQGIEKIFANMVEEPYEKYLAKLIEQCDATPWTIQNCFFISEQEKVEFSEFLALQYIRTKQIRNRLLDQSDCFLQVLRDMDAPEKLINEWTTGENEAKNIHAKMLMDFQHLSEIARSFYNLTWSLGLNKTDKLFYTSDSPIGTQPHIHHPFMSMAGLQSKGVEVFFPISPRCILIMYDGSFLTPGKEMNRKYIEIVDEKNVDYYNSLCALNCERCVFSTDGDWSVIDDMLTKDENVFKQPHMQLQWGGKTYTPSNI